MTFTQSLKIPFDDEIHYLLQKYNYTPFKPLNVRFNGSKHTSKEILLKEIIFRSIIWFNEKKKMGYVIVAIILVTYLRKYSYFVFIIARVFLFVDVFHRTLLMSIIKCFITKKCLLCWILIHYLLNDLSLHELIVMSEYFARKRRRALALSGSGHNTQFTNAFCSIGTFE